MTDTPPAASPYPPYPQQSDWTVPAAPARRKNRPALWIGVGVLLGLCCLGGIVGGKALLNRQVSSSVQPVRDAAEAFFDAVIHDQDPYSRLCTDARSAFTRAQFEQYQAVRPLAGYEITNATITNINGRVSASVSVALSFASGSVEKHLVPMANEDGTWKVCGRPY